MKRVLLIDLSGIFWSAWHATSDRELSAAFEITVGKVIQLNSGFDHVAICADAPPYNRKARFEGYKANRSAAPPQALAQLARVKQRLEADGFCIYECKGLEADDVAATVVELARREDPPIEITIASSDKDLAALVSDSGFVRLMSTSDGKVYDEKGVAERLGVPPKLVPDWLALTGDSSDGIPGVKGIGPKKAVALLERFGDILGVLEATPEELAGVVGKLGEAVASSRDAIRLALDLIKLDTTAPIDLDALFAERTPKPLGPAGEWDEDKFDQVLPPVKTPAPEPNPPAQEQAITVPKIQALAVRPAEWSMQLEPSSARDAYTVAKYFEGSRLYPHLGSRDAIFTVILRGRALGLDAATACALFHVVEGRPVMHAELILGLVMRSGRAEYFECIETSDERATWATKRMGGRAEIKISWDMPRALKAGLVQADGRGGYKGVSRSGRPSNWDKYGRTMLRWRAGTELAHAVYPEIVSGLVTPDEAEGIDYAAE